MATIDRIRAGAEYARARYGAATIRPYSQGGSIKEVGR